MIEQIYIPTLGRFDKQFAWDGLPSKWKDRAALVCPPSEAAEHEKRGRQVLRSTAKGIGKVRDWIIEHAHRGGYTKIVMLDDDVRLQIRRIEEKQDDQHADGKPYQWARITNPTSPKEYDEAFNWLDKTLNRTAHCGWMARFLDWKTLHKEEWEPFRLMYCLAYNVPMVKKVGASFTKGLPSPCVMEDFNMTLQLMAAGHPAVASLKYRMHPGTSNSPGGCSTWRNVQNQEASARALAKRFPNVVTLVQKKMETTWQGMTERTDVRVRWQKALNKDGK